jgi:hypothetical protein
MTRERRAGLAQDDKGGKGSRVSLRMTTERTARSARDVIGRRETTYLARNGKGDTPFRRIVTEYEIMYDFS